MDDNDIDRLYHAERDEPHKVLDDAVLAMAAHRQPPTNRLGRYKRAPLLASAAVLVVSVSIFLAQPVEQTLELRPESPAMMDATPSASAPPAVQGFAAKSNKTTVASTAKHARAEHEKERGKEPSMLFAAEMDLFEEALDVTQQTIDDPGCSEPYVIPDKASLREDQTASFVLDEQIYQVSCREQLWVIEPALVDAP